MENEKKKSNLGENMENKLRNVVRYSTSHTHFCEYMSFFLLYILWKKKFTTTQINFFHGRNQKTRVNLTTSLNLLSIFSPKLVIFFFSFSNVFIKRSLVSIGFTALKVNYSSRQMSPAILLKI